MRGSLRKRGEAGAFFGCSLKSPHLSARQGTQAKTLVMTVPGERSMALGEASKKKKLFFFGKTPKGWGGLAESDISLSEKN